jgi:ribosomal protein L11 methyltransferase
MQEKATHWTAVEITAVPGTADALEHFLNEAGAVGTEIQEMPLSSTTSTTVTGYFEGPIDDWDFQDELQFTLSSFGLEPECIENITRREIVESDWLAEWKKHWKPTVVGNFQITPSWEDADSADKTVILIDPGMAFGTGTHETTQLCLKAIEENFIPGESFLDVGTGTGVLAIAAAKLSSRMLGLWLANDEHPGPILGIDNDPEASAIAAENCRLNDVADLVRIEAGVLDHDSTDFDVTCANLTLDAILPILPLLLAKTRRLLILSGILVEQRDAIASQLEKLGIENPAFQTMGEWISVIVAIEKP